MTFPVLPDPHLDVVLPPLAGAAEDLVRLQDLPELPLRTLVLVHVRMKLLGELVEVVLDLVSIFVG